jgi:two-component system NtrC family sensor kinase
MNNDPYKEAHQREKSARFLAEKLGEELTRKVFDQNQKLESVNRDLKLNQLALIQQEKMASVGLLASGIAHEINNPLGFSLSNLSVLLDYIKYLETFFKNLQNREGLSADIAQLINDEELKYIFSDMPALVNESIFGLESVKEIVTDLRKFSRNGEDNTVPTDINEGIRTTLTVLRSELKYGVSVETEFGQVPLVNANPGKLNQVFANLILNASQAMEESGIIHIRSLCDDAFVIIEITDDGPGVPDEIQMNIFDPFFTTKPIGKGTGLGLSICYTIIVEEHAGIISVSNNSGGKGATFTIKIPIKGA